MVTSKIKSMKGISLIGMLLWIILIVMIILTCIKAVPPYLQNRVVQEAMEKMAKDPNVIHLSKPKLKDTFSRSLEVNYIHSVPAEALTLENSDDKYWLAINYEVRVPFVANIDAIFKFNNKVMVESK